MAGLYIHIPFCKAKCRYCDFYSLPELSSTRDYIAALEKTFCDYGKIYKNKKFESVYIGGGTPSVMGAALADILLSARRNLNIESGAEITSELNPESTSPALLDSLKAAGFNRLSFGIQSADDKTLKLIGRLHNFMMAKNAVISAEKAGFDNISADIICGLPGENADSFSYSLKTVLDLPITHLSMYLLKLEPGTPLYNEKDKLSFPEEDGLCGMYTDACAYLKSRGFDQYEISNFCKNGLYSRHNANYWERGEYLGVGPGAHSFMDGVRFEAKRDLWGFIDGKDIIKKQPPMKEEEQLEEYIMLGLRMTKGLDLGFLSGRGLEPELFLQKCGPFIDMGYMKKTSSGVALTGRGFLVSNYIISRLI